MVCTLDVLLRGIWRDAQDIVQCRVDDHVSMEEGKGRRAFVGVFESLFFSLAMM